MPRYRYICGSCACERMIFHLIDEVVNLGCDACDSKDQLQRALTSPTYTMPKVGEASKIGSITEEYIEKNREILEQEKKEAKEITYEPT
jgi:hypothetical protein